jgi:hypothetical protein
MKRKSINRQDDSEDLKWAINLIFSPLRRYADFLNDLAESDYYDDSASIHNGNLRSNMLVLYNMVLETEHKIEQIGNRCNQKSVWATRDS